jgi:hypothetical protein
MNAEELERLCREATESPEKFLAQVALNQLRIINRLDKIIEQNEKIMASQADLDATIQTVVTDFTANLSSSVQEVITAIQAKAPGDDFSTEVASLQALDAQITGMPAAIATALQPVVAGTAPAAGSAAPAAGAAQVSRAKI